MSAVWLFFLPGVTLPHGVVFTETRLRGHPEPSPPVTMSEDRVAELMSNV